MRPAESPAPARDPGLQPERTRLAWRRTTLTCAVTAVLAIRQAIHSERFSPLAICAAALAGLVWVAFVTVAHRRIRAMADPRPPDLSPRAALTIAACIVAIAAIGAAIVL